MGTDLSETRRDRCVERHWGDSPLRKSTEGNYSEAYDDKNINYRGKSSDRGKSRSLREDKDHRSRHKDRKTIDGVKGRGKDLKDSDKDRISRKRVRKEGIEEQGKDKTNDYGREKDLDREKQRRNVYDRNVMDRERERYHDRDQGNHHDTVKDAKSKSCEHSIEQTHFSLKKEDVAEFFAEDAADLQKPFERARKLPLKNLTEKASIEPVDISYLATSAVSSQSLEAKNSTSKDAMENNVVFTEMDEFVSGLQLDEGISHSRPFSLSYLCVLVRLLIIVLKYKQITKCVLSPCIHYFDESLQYRVDNEIPNRFFGSRNTAVFVNSL